MIGADPVYINQQPLQCLSSLIWMVILKWGYLKGYTLLVDFRFRYSAQVLCLCLNWLFCLTLKSFVFHYHNLVVRRFLSPRGVNCCCFFVFLQPFSINWSEAPVYINLALTLYLLRRRLNEQIVMVYCLSSVTVNQICILSLCLTIFPYCVSIREIYTVYLLFLY